MSCRSADELVITLLKIEGLDMSFNELSFTLETASGMLCSVLDSPVKKKIMQLSLAEGHQDGQGPIIFDVGGKVDETGFVQP